MNFYWYSLFNKLEFEATALVSRTMNFQLEGRGQESVLVTHGNTIAVLHTGTLLPLNFLGHNPYVRDGKAIYVDEQSQVWLGFEVPE